MENSPCPPPPGWYSQRLELAEAGEDVLRQVRQAVLAQLEPLEVGQVVERAPLQRHHAVVVQEPAKTRTINALLRHSHDSERGSLPRGIEDLCVVTGSDRAGHERSWKRV